MAEYKSLYEFRGHPVRNKEEARSIYEQAKARGVEIKNQEVSNPKFTGTVLTYPVWFLEEYFHKSEPKDNAISADDDLLFDELPF